MKYLLHFFFLTCCFSLIGQNHFLEKKGNTYFYKGETYKYNQLADVYSIHQESLDLYTSGRQYKKTANTLAIIGLISAGGGFVAIYAGNSVNGLIYGALLIAAGIVIELIALVPRAIGGRKIRKARNVFNNEMIERHGYNSDVSLTFGSTNGGIGFVMTF